MGARTDIAFELVEYDGLSPWAYSNLQGLISRGRGVVDGCEPHMVEDELPEDQSTRIVYAAVAAEVALGLNSSEDFVSE